MLARSESRSGSRLSARRGKALGPPALFLAAALVTLGVAASCGPSVQSIYEGNVRFEHCYRLDLDLDVAPTHREACWKRWLSTYTYGQPRDRIEYARRRVRAFAAGDSSRPALNVGGEHRPQDRQFYLVVPSPTSVHAPPPPIATRVRGGESERPPKEVSPTAAAASAPASNCADGCRAAWDSCRTACEAEQAALKDGSASSDEDPKKPDAAQKPAKAQGSACKSCEPDYKACMKRCFE